LFSRASVNRRRRRRRGHADDADGLSAGADSRSQRAVVSAILRGTPLCRPNPDSSSHQQQFAIIARRCCSQAWNKLHKAQGGAEGTTCTVQQSPGENAGPTAAGGMDVTAHGCTTNVLESMLPAGCCGMLPRWNWVLGSCIGANESYPFCSDVPGVTHSLEP
jgi:hypothetical protein